MGPKKRDKVPIRRSHSSFKYMIPLGTTEQYENMKQAIKRRVEGKGYPHELKRLKQEEEEEKKRKKEKGEGGEGEDGKGGGGGGGGGRRRVGGGIKRRTSIPPCHKSTMTRRSQRWRGRSYR